MSLVGNRLPPEITLNEAGEFLKANDLYLAAFRFNSKQGYVHLCRESSGRGYEAWADFPYEAINLVLDKLEIPLTREVK